MKTILSIFVTVLLFCNAEKTYAHTGNLVVKINLNAQQDTSKHLATILANKSKYHGKSLNVLLNDLKVNVKSWSPIRGKKPGAPVTQLYFYFESRSITHRKLMHDLKVHRLHITFKEEVTNAWGLYIQTDQGLWNDIVKVPFGKLIVSDISVY